MSFTNLMEYIGITQRKPKVNFPSNPSQLFLYIHSQNWTSTVEHAKEHPEEVRTWIEKENGNECWCVLPLHAAIMLRAPSVVLETLLELYPDGATKRDDLGNLPLHLAANLFQPDDTVIDALLQEYDEALRHPNINGGISICDYCSNRPHSFDLVQSQKWDELIDYVDDHPDELKTWVVRREKYGHVRWRIMPLHAAIIYGAPAHVVRKLIEHFPEATKCRDDKGQTPLHREIRKEVYNTAVVDMLVTAMSYPFGVTEFRRNECTSVDYDENCTELYKFVEGREWSAVMSRAITNPEEAQTWVEKRDDSEFSSEEFPNVLWRRLPLHATLKRNPPLIVVEALVTGYVDAILCRDDKGLLPLHIANNNNNDGDDGGDDGAGRNLEVVKFLVKALEKPEQICLRDKMGITLLANYDINPPKLYKLLEARSWTECLSHIKTCPDDAQTWTMRKQTNGTLRWRMLPIHAAIVFDAPPSVVEELLAAYRDGLQCRDDQGMTPLNLAKVKRCRYDIVTLLMGNGTGGSVGSHSSGSMKISRR